ncbi:biotin--[acetyl-CoA-carboxylase] ligase [Microbacterium indicum]|uniref:biotin--[acetyl-CoA-carboxylase] ligase n=1 Tax=Microbacterium indicum TaxID=358100 RepID=UPI0004004626|nr:biotin--[acetyl-CoA-carboxylase] ligase [Microbacterium indicum]
MPRIVEVPHTGSTNADLVAALAAGEDLDHLHALVTRDQRGGRGRLDRSWDTPAGSSIALSLVLRVGRIPAERRGWIPLVAGAAMAAAIGEQLPGHDVGVKWPNDVLVDGRKICGILAEVALPDAVVVGSGVNTRMTAEDLPVPTATSFAALDEEADEERLIRDYRDRLSELLAVLERRPARAEVERVLVTLGREVTAHLPGGGKLTGVAEHLDDDGRIVIAGRAVAAADVVHLRPAV